MTRSSEHKTNEAMNVFWNQHTSEWWSPLGGKGKDDGIGDSSLNIWKIND